MADLDARVTVADVQTQINKERAQAEADHKKEKDDENKSYYSGQLDLLDRLEAFISA